MRQHLIAAEEASEEYAADLLERCDGEIDKLTAKIVAQAAADGNAIALDVLHHSWQVLGWGIAQMITLLAPAAVVIGGGVSLMGEPLFFNPLARGRRSLRVPAVSRHVRHRAGATRRRDGRAWGTGTGENAK